MAYKKESLEKLLLLIDEICNEEENLWFKNELTAKFNKNSSNKINEIYEHCIKLIIKDHANKFYADFKLNDIKDKMIFDFIRMEQFRREDNFEDFCLASFQQFEALVNSLCNENYLITKLIEDKNLPAIFKYDVSSKRFERKGNQTICNLIFQTTDSDKIDLFLKQSPKEWYFNIRYRAILYYYYFNNEVKINSDNYEKMYEIGNYLYQGRNINHRGTNSTKYQNSILEKIVPEQHKYYFKFLGFLENFIGTVNINLKLLIK